VPCRGSGRFGSTSTEGLATVIHGGLTVTVIETVRALEALRREWTHLVAAAGGGLPFLTCEWHVAWWRHFRARRVGVADSLFVHTVRHGSHLVAIAPFMLTNRPGHKLGVRTIEFMGADPTITEIRRVLCDPHAEAAVYRALTTHLHQQRHGWDRIHWRGIVAGSAGESVLAGEVGVQFTAMRSRTWSFPSPTTGTGSRPLDHGTSKSRSASATTRYSETGTASTSRSSPPPPMWLLLSMTSSVCTAHAP
jgi:hypothetical protein